MTTTRSANMAMPPLVAHRGASHYAPENTMPAFRLAWQEHATRIEGDFWMTADGEIVCIHDPTTGRTAPNQPEVDVQRAKFIDFAHYDVGSWKSEEFKNTTVPRLSEILAEMASGTMLYMEIKQDSPKIISTLLEVIDESPVQLDQVVLISFSAAIVRRSKKMAPDMKALLIYDIDGIDEERAGGIALDEVAAFASSLGADGIDFGKHNQIDNQLVQTLRACKLEFHIWTVNTLDDALKYLKLGVDSITTDRPQGLRQELEIYCQ